MKRYEILNSDEAKLARMLREHKEREYAELLRVIEAGNPAERRALAVRNHAGVGSVRWRPGRIRHA